MGKEISWIVHHSNGEEEFATRVSAPDGDSAVAKVLAANKGHEGEHAYGDNGRDEHHGREVVEFGAKPKPKAEPEPQDPATVRVK